MCVSHGKPDLNIIFEQIQTNLKFLENGLNINLTNIHKNVKFFLIASVFDKPARALVLNTINFTGFYGCLKCEQPGKTIKHQSK